ncbi:MAG: hypothetical protein C0616_05170 [Desulfuromonas sp.]|nr:MAG: hypothetical protein C0616_05170 [Desulfuromonas sp.]
MTESEWERRCRRCGRCCYEKVDDAGRIFVTSQPCPHLDQDSRLCRIYHDRARLHPECIKITPDIVPLGWLPADCPYVADVPDYVAPAPWRDET